MEADWEDVRAGELIGECYELVDPAGKGAMAQIWRARDRRSGRQVAMKFLRLDSEDLLQLDARDREEELHFRRIRFCREARFLARLRHPNIPEHYDFGTHHGVPYLVMSYVVGINLRAFLKQYAPLAPLAATSAATQIAAAFVHAHELRVLHRDLKPDNVMISERGVGFLIDFGIGKELGIESTLTQPGSTLGTQGYQAPEQIQGEEATAAWDVYSFCCVFYELLTGRPPFVANARDGSVERQHLRNMPLRPGDLAAGIPDALDKLVLQGLSKEPELRPTMREILDVLVEFTPKPGDPEPLPQILHDPTRPFRCPETTVPPDESPQQKPTWSTEENEQERWLDPDAIALLCTAAERELTEGGPGGAVSELAGLTSRVREEWGRRPLVRKVWELTAGGLWLAGNFHSAAQRYQSIAEELVPGKSPQDRADRAVFGLRAARCRLELDGIIEAAVDVVAEAGYLASSLPEPYASQLETEQREVADRISALLAERDGDSRASTALERE
ncbi:serine/threonine-protein kinase [Streptomyces sp. NPDC006684]|uniref:serine/threonine-protein kinase n=1 Tax=Streptomyces sp. NPDC006684 TaxID=3154477 RepID=UPI0034515E31